MFDPLTATAADLQELLTSQQLRSVDLVEKYRQQIDTYNGYLHAVLQQAPLDLVMSRAAAMDLERQEEKLRGPLHGIPILVKDNIATHPDLGMDTTAGSLALKGSKPRNNAPVVEQLLRAGAIIIGKANLSELSYYKGTDLACGWSPVGGQTQSAYVRGGFRDDDSFVGHSNTSGSSSGSAVAVAAGFAPFSLGSETEGSLISPSNRAALYTLKPTMSIVPQAGVIPIAKLFDSVGPMTKNARDVALLMDVLVNPELTQIPKGGYVSAVTGQWNGLRIGTVDPEVWGYEADARKPQPGAEEQMLEETRLAYEKLQGLAESYHHHVPLITEDAFNVGGKNAIFTLLSHFIPSEFAEYMSTVTDSSISTLEDLIEYNRAHADVELPPKNPKQDLIEDAVKMNLSKNEVDSLIHHVRDVGRTRGIDKIFEEFNVNVIVGPAESGLTGFASATGYPIATLPLGYLDFNGRPHGLAAIAGPHQDALLIQLQSAWEASTAPRKPPVLQPEWAHYQS
ncbi:Uncharacterized protein PECH_001205 [Penicillium ucsense]|uniref:Amidase domain-containing protein n=1 Tax=Penicillium ucsense TaxID=2839758 RepID=A0A8J8W8H9_9EURO|nr:Uncharacterized protein PECM_000006 [Penicillium ucsense]KAF7733055.1 Uncharacterized protein PECH_001205 [Penicillium ucsense]